MATILDASGRIDAANPENLNDKVLSERETRKKLLTHARMVGCERDMMLLFNKYDKLMRNCTNEKERLDMGKLGAYEMYRLLGGGGQLFVNGQLVADDEPKKK
jgi:hypothetical protein